VGKTPSLIRACLGAILALALGAGALQPQSARADSTGAFVVNIGVYNTSAGQAVPTSVTVSPQLSTATNAGDSLTYYAYIQNTSAVDQNVFIRDVVQAGQTVTGCSMCTSGFPTAGSNGQTIVQSSVFTVPTGAIVSQPIFTVTVSLSVTISSITNAYQLVDTAGNVLATCTPASVYLNLPTPVTATKSVRDLTHSGSTTVQPGDVLQYSVNVTNTGTVQANNLIITDTLSGPQTFQSCPQGSCTSSSTGNTLVGSPFNLAPAGQQGSSATGTFNVTVNSNATPGSLVTNQFQVTGNNISATNNNCGSVTPPNTVCSNYTSLTVGAALTPLTTTVTATKAATDLTTGQSSVNGVLNANPGDTIRYNVSVANNTSVGASGLHIVDQLSPDLTFVGCNSCSTQPSSVNGRATTTMTGPAFTLASGGQAGSTANGYFVVKVNSGFTGQIRNSFVVFGGNIATTSSNTVLVNVAAPAPAPTTLTIQKLVRDVTTGGTFASTAQARPGDVLQYRIIVNSTSGTAYNVKVADTLQSGQLMELNSCGCTSGATNNYTFALGNVTAGTAAVVTFNVTVPVNASGTIYNKATAFASNAASVYCIVATYVVAPTVVYPPVFVPPSYGNGNVCTYPSFTNCGFGNVSANSLTVCGTVTAFSASTSFGVGGLTIGGENFLLAQNTAYTGQSLSVGLGFCITFTVSTNGLVSAVAASPNLAGTNYVCGVVSPFTNGYYPYANYAPNGYLPYAGYNPYYSGTTMGPYAMNGQFNGYYGFNGPMVIGGYPFQVSSSTVFPFTIGYNTSYCFLLSNSGSVSGSLSVIPTAAHTIDLPSGMRHGRANGTD